MGNDVESVSGQPSGLREGVQMISYKLTVGGLIDILRDCNEDDYVWVDLILEKPKPKLKTQGKILGVDIGNRSPKRDR